ncbi:unnamed protein product [Amoebophrya sp. A25]|nr:unnamed protein product [Amoebophrya sp. A25]|eukprot:GSA25T00018272001.1
MLHCSHLKFNPELVHVVDKNAAEESSTSTSEKSSTASSAYFQKTSQCSQVELAVMGGKFCLLSLGFGRLNIWDLSTQKIVQRLQCNASGSNISKFAYNQRTQQLALALDTIKGSEVQVFRKADDAKTSTSLPLVFQDRIELGTSGALALEFSEVDESLCVLRRGTYELASYPTNGGEGDGLISSRNERAKTLSSTHAGEPSPRKTAGDEEEGEDAELVDGVVGSSGGDKISTFARLFGGESSTSTSCLSKEEAAETDYERALRACVVGGVNMKAESSSSSSSSSSTQKKFVALPNKQFVEQVVDPRTSSHVLPTAEHLLHRFFSLLLPTEGEQRSRSTQGYDLVPSASSSTNIDITSAGRPARLASSSSQKKKSGISKSTTSTRDGASSEQSDAWSEGDSWFSDDGDIAPTEFFSKLKLC